MRIHWNSGPRTYDSANEATQELKKRGIAVEEPNRRAAGTEMERRLQRDQPWQRVGGKGGSSETAQQARERLREFQWGIIE